MGKRDVRRNGYDPKIVLSEKETRVSAVWRRIAVSGQRFWWPLVLLAAIVACSRSPAPPLSPPPEDALRELLDVEAAAVVAQDIDRLVELWAPDGVVVDAKHTPADPADDARWEGIDAIRDRYVTLVFPGAAITASHPIVTMVVVGDTATVTTTTRIGSEVAPAGDRWTFVRRAGRWWIASLTYNLEP